MTHRALMVAALAEGRSTIVGAGDGEDNISTRAAMTALGARFADEDGDIIVDGVGLRGLRDASAPIDCGNSGTTARLLAGVLAGAGVTATLTGDASLSVRPMRRVADPLTDLGYTVTVTGERGTLPLTVTGGRRSNTEPVRAVLNVASAQVKSCILLSGLFRGADTEVVEPAVSRDHTERLLRAFGVRCASTEHYTRPAEAHGTVPVVRLVPPASLRGRRIEVPGDLSSAAFLIAAGILRGESVAVNNVGTNPTRAAFLDLVQEMGADVTRRNRRVLEGGEPVADLEVSAGPLRGVTIEGAAVPIAIDEIPILCVLGAASSGRFVVRDAAELRVKESDRIEHTAGLLRAMGVDVEETPDGLQFEGLGAASFKAFEVDAAHDHRIAMSAAVAALCADGVCSITGAEAIDISYPSFADTLRSLGAVVDGVGR